MKSTIISRLQFRYGDRWGPVRPGKSHSLPMQEEVILADGETITAFGGSGAHYPETLQFNTSARVCPKLGISNQQPKIFASLKGLLYFGGASRWGIVSQVKAYRSMC